MDTNGSYTRTGVSWCEEELAEARAQAAHWRAMYRVMVRILAEQKPDPAYEWLDQITRMKSVGVKSVGS